MDVLAGRKRLGVEDVSTNVTVSSNCWARLMYYLDSVNSCLNDDGDDLVPRSLRNHEMYYALSEDEKLVILAVCTGPLLISNLVGKILFPAKDLDGNSNKFYKITETTELVALGIRADRVVGIGGSKKEVNTIMLMTEGWANKNFFKPLEEAARSLQRQAQATPTIQYRSYQSPSPSYTPSYVSPSYSTGKKGCLAGKFKHILLFIIGLAILGYVSYEIAPVYVDQKDALEAPDYSAWPLNIHTALITLSGEEVAYVKVYFDSSGVNMTANSIAVTTTSPAQVDVAYARGRYSLWDRQYDPPEFLGVTDLLSEDSFVYFRFQLVNTGLTTTFTATFAGAHSTTGSSDWTTIQWVQQAWFYGLFSLGA
eukprot:CAMPEP_0184373598 /NCGR_PEP_ID=MMETSP1089-20130417/164587_1 /TAXON_ID=38269 ORGANISM="Gloeochaete wittrockiana, Strain SAG46.84" /NCGR_SAMPLE_ID=MMETSP1089 /ASSEMBLY_ACC=CAM_ASM_000445 /LENGTH=366 /DNA_ID=CAMNT_0026716569 /DNA_START=52 /DNA_END=1148 /DNA_ORIENTATION=+